MSSSKASQHERGRIYWVRAITFQTTHLLCVLPSVRLSVANLIGRFVMVDIDFSTMKIAILSTGYRALGGTCCID